MLIEQVPDALFFCLQFLIPVLLLIRVLKLPLTNLNFRALVIATNITILVAGSLTGGILLYEGCTILYAGAETQQFTLLGRFTGTFSMFAWLSLVTQVILPQIMWNRSICKSIASATAWLVTTIVFRLANMLLLQYVVEKEGASWTAFIPDRSAKEYLTQIIIFLVMFSALYMLINKKRRRVPRRSHHTELS